MSCGAHQRRGSDLALLRLWQRLAAVAPIRPLAWEPLYVTGSAKKGIKGARDSEILVKVTVSLKRMRSVLLFGSFVHYKGISGAIFQKGFVQSQHSRP